MRFDLDGREIIGDLATAGHDFGTTVLPGQTVSARKERAVARFALRLLENCPEDASVLDVREAIQDAYPGVLSGGAE